jgi:hypothetical protein
MRGAYGILVRNISSNGQQNGTAHIMELQNHEHSATNISDATSSSSHQYNENNVTHFSLNLLKIKDLCTFQALLAGPQEALHKRHSVYCVCIFCVPRTLVAFYQLQRAPTLPECRGIPTESAASRPTEQRCAYKRSARSHPIECRGTPTGDARNLFNRWSRPLAKEGISRA